jgi:hypothetical protein
MKAETINVCVGLGPFGPFRSLLQLPAHHLLRHFLSSRTAAYLNDNITRLMPVAIDRQRISLWCRSTSEAEAGLLDTSDPQFPSFPLGTTQH